jgi:hypothetical protein
VGSFTKSFIAALRDGLGDSADISTFQQADYIRALRYVIHTGGASLLAMLTPSGVNALSLAFRFIEPYAKVTQMALQLTYRSSLTLRRASGDRNCEKLAFPMGWTISSRTKNRDYIRLRVRRCIGTVVCWFRISLLQT